MASDAFFEAFRPYMMGAQQPQEEAVMIDRAPGPGSQQIDIAAMMQGPSVAAPRKKRTVGNVLADLFANSVDAQGIPRSEKIVGLGDAFINAARNWRGDSPISMAAPMREARMQQENWTRQQEELARAGDARNMLGELLVNPTPEGEAALARLDPGTLLEYRGQQQGQEGGQRELLGQALAAVAGTKNPAEAWMQVAGQIPGADPAMAERIGKLLASGQSPEILAQAMGYTPPKQGSLPSAIQNYLTGQEILATQGPEAYEAFLRFAAPGQTVSPSQAADDARADEAAARDDRRLALQESKDEREAAAAERKAAGGADLTPTQRGNVKQKLEALPHIKTQLARVKALAGQMKDEGTMARGSVAGLLPGQIVGGKAEVFDRATDSLRQYIRGLTRTPGEGSMSDYESRLAAITIPSRWGSDAGRAESIAALETLVNSLESGYKEMLGPTPSATPKSAPAKSSGGRSVKGGRIDPKLEAAMKARGLKVN